ncbi:MAG TPA: heavy-metal-associated domain-containing protein [Candidatus Limivivens intestinipullorum]|uniref:Heavy-metal-associated domain-containing protein n=1 Tax=Candidatus Limivivens intestinipullorum TaxID=2840858 RepID=A0A9D1EVA5_9FIRM|nr:heavy-metal-associated domain-containing protein [Candidatus Limivivens intestinipullorum]
MIDVIILLIVVVLLIFAVKGSIKHFKGEGPCCGGGFGTSAKPEEKKLSNPVIGKKTVNISGMHCDHCVKSVTDAINEIDGASAKVSLKEEKAVVSYDREVADADIRRAVEKAGFQVVSITG